MDSRHEKVQERSKSTRHPPRLIDEYAESIAGRLDGGDLTDEIAAQLRTLVRHRSELCPAVRKFLIRKLHFAAQRNIGFFADQLTYFAAQLAANLPQHLALERYERAADRSHHRSAVRNAVAPLPRRGSAMARVSRDSAAKRNSKVDVRLPRCRRVVR